MLHVRRTRTAAPGKRRGALLATALLVVSLLPAVAVAAPAGDEPVEALWTSSSAKPSGSRGEHIRQVNPSKYRAYTLDADRLDDILDDAPEEDSKAARRGGSVDLVVPAPTGELVHFAIVDSPIMEDGLAAAHPDIRTYAGTSTTPGYVASIRLDVTPQGFHAAVRGDQDSWYVDPAHLGDDSLYLSYFGAALPRGERNLVEPELDHETHEKVAQGATQLGGGAGAAVKQRVYRLALLTDPTYAEYLAPGLNDGTQDAASNEAVLAAKVTLINRVNAIYNDDLAIKLVLIDGTDALNLNTVAKISGAGGPCGGAACFTANLVQSCSSGTLTRQRHVIGLLAGAANFDIGHLMLGLDGGGIASLGAVGGSAKAQGCTGLPDPVGDMMAIDYVAHEIGHQFAGNHTFNGVTSNCSGANRSAATSVEPGSGSSVMAYAGICGSDNLQPHSDPYFSQRTQSEIGAYVSGAPTSVNEVQAVALKDFDGADSFTLTFDGTPTDPITNGVNYTAAGIKAAVQAVTGGTVTVSSVAATGFQLTFAGGSDFPNAVLNAGSGFTGFASDIVQGGPDTRGGGSVVTTSNRNPVVTGQDAVSIPTRTPFTLTGSADDADGDAMTYLWEQNDRGSAAGTGLTDGVKANGPLFRQFGTFANVSSADTLLYDAPGQNHAHADPTRTFPDMTQILGGATNAATGTCADGATARDCYSEFLPTSAYVGESAAGNTEPSLNFRLTARDLHPSGGGTSYADTKLTIVPSAGPFQVTSQAAPTTWSGGAAQTISWDVNGTNIPALAEDVKITLSTNGGESFDHVLAESTPNDGSQSVTVPGVSTSEGRLKIEAVGNVFFDVNDAPITIESTMSVDNALPASIPVMYSDPVPASFSASTPEGDADLLTATPSGLPVGLGPRKTPTSAAGVVPGTATFTLDGTVREGPGSYPVTISVTDGTTTQLVDFTIVVSVDTTAPDTSITSGPRDNSFLLNVRTAFGFVATESPATFDCWLDGRARACAGGVVSLAGLSAGTHRFNVAARDAWSNLDATPASRVFTVPVDDRALKGKGWKRKKSSSSFRQTYTQANKKGAKLTYRVTRATSLSLVVPKGKKYGKVKVYLNRTKLRTVSLAGRSASQQVIHLKSFPKGKSGTVKIVTANNKTIRIDALGVVTTR